MGWHLTVPKITFSNAFMVKRWTLFQVLKHKTGRPNGGWNLKQHTCISTTQKKRRNTIFLKDWSIWIFLIVLSDYITNSRIFSIDLFISCVTMHWNHLKILPCGVLYQTCVLQMHALLGDSCSHLFYPFGICVCGIFMYRKKIIFKIYIDRERERESEHFHV